MQTCNNEKKKKKNDATRAQRQCNWPPGVRFASRFYNPRHHTSWNRGKRMFPGYHENFSNYAESRLKTNLTAIKKVVTSRP